MQYFPLHKGCHQPGGLWGLTIKHNALAPVCYPGAPLASGSVTDQWWLAKQLAKSVRVMLRVLHLATTGTILVTVSEIYYILAILTHLQITFPM